MAIENITETVGNAPSDLLEILEPLIAKQLGPLMTIFKAVGIAVLVYVIFLIIRAIFRWRSTSKIVKISKDVSEINQKLDILISSRKSKSIEPEKNKTIKKKNKK